MTNDQLRLVVWCGTAITLFVTMVVVNRLGIAIAKSHEPESGQLEGAAGDVNS